MSECYIDKAAGMNGGFEVTQKGLPVNWLIYSPKTVPNADFDVYLDTLHFKEGRQSLCFDVRSCSATGGWHSPGFTNQFEEVSGFNGPATYTIRMWVKHDNAQYRIMGGGVSAKKEGSMKVLHKNFRGQEDWKLLEFNVEVAEGLSLRLEFNVLQAGKVWVDGIEVEMK